MFGNIFGNNCVKIPDINPLVKHLVTNTANSLIDNIVKDKVMPIKGSIVHCELVFGTSEHSGIYIGNNQIVHLNGDGDIESVSPKKFLNRLDGWNSAVSIYVSCDEEFPVGSYQIAKRAQDMIGKSRDYNVIDNNCHKFTAGCITGNFENSHTSWTELKSLAKRECTANTWRVWDT